MRPRVCVSAGGGGGGGGRGAGRGELRQNVIIFMNAAS